MLSRRGDGRGCCVVDLFKPVNLITVDRMAKFGRHLSSEGQQSGRININVFRKEDKNWERDMEEITGQEKAGGRGRKSQASPT